MYSSPMSAWILSHLQANKMSQAELARRTGLCKQYISRLCNGATHPQTGRPIRPERETLEALANALRATPQETKRLFYMNGLLPSSTIAVA